MDFFFSSLLEGGTKIAYILQKQEALCFLNNILNNILNKKVSISKDSTVLSLLEIVSVVPKLVEYRLLLDL